GGMLGRAHQLAAAADRAEQRRTDREAGADEREADRESTDLDHRLGALLGLARPIYLGLVLRRAAGHDLPGGDDGAAVASLDDHLAPLREHVGQDATVRDGDGVTAVLAAELEGEIVGGGVPVHAPAADPALHPQVLTGMCCALGEELV